MDLKEKPKINEWLEELESQMRLYLSEYFSKGVLHWQSIKNNKEIFLEIFDQFCNQVILFSF